MMAGTMKKVDLTFHWNRIPGKFVNKLTGKGINLSLNGVELSIGPQFTGSIAEWYETLIETLIDLRNHLHKLAKKDAEEIIVRADPDTMRMIQASVLYRPSENDAWTGTLSGFQVITDKRARRFNPAMEFVYKDGAKSKVLVGQVVILED
jgi:hypothetical protein